MLHGTIFTVIGHYRIYPKQSEAIDVNFGLRGTPK